MLVSLAEITIIYLTSYFIMLIDTLPNSFLGLRKSKSGDKAESISLLTEVGLQFVHDNNAVTATFRFCPRSLTFANRV